LKVRPIAITSPDRLHLGGERGVGGREFLEGEAGDLDHDIIEHRLERGGRGPGDVVGQLVEPVPDRRPWCRSGRWGKPVALEASADERDTRGFISITSCSPVVGLTANWMLHPPAATPISRMIRMAASRMT
jgi:hypothetical protein